MSNPEFRYSLRINTTRRLSIIRYPNDSHIFAALVTFSQTLPVEEFYSLTRTAREISVIQDAKYPTYPLELGECMAEQIQVEEGFVMIEIVPDSGHQIDFAVTGLLARLAGILAEEKIAIFAISTFDTDYILIRGEAVAKAKRGFVDSDIKTEVVKI